MMNSKFKFLFLLFLCGTTLFLNSCSKKQDPSSAGEVVFKYNPKTTNNGRVSEDKEPKYLVVSIVQGSQTVYNKKEVALYKFNEEYVSEALSLPHGQYTLTEFIVLDADKNIIYATPIQGSDLAYLISDPLPKDFGVDFDDVTTVTTEVISTDGYSPAQFGYASFKFEVQPIFNFLIAVFASDPGSGTLDLTTADLSVYNNSTSDLINDFSLSDSTNSILLPEIWGSYKLVISKDGFSTYSRIISLNDLKSYSAGENGPLTVVLKQGSGNTVVIVPDSISGKDALINSYNPDTSYPGYRNVQVNNWTENGSDEIFRTLVEFDLSQIPDGASIQNATINLYYYPAWDWLGGQTDQGNNESMIQRITEPWQEYAVTWNNQPSTTTQNQVIVPASTSSTQDYQIDVTSLVSDMIHDKANSYGMLFKLANEQATYSILTFASSDHENYALHPKLEISYTE